jgi:hypothetical protein
MSMSGPCRQLRRQAVSASGGGKSTGEGEWERQGEERGAAEWGEGAPGCVEALDHGLRCRLAVAPAPREADGAIREHLPPQQATSTTRRAGAMEGAAEADLAFDAAVGARRRDYNHDAVAEAVVALGADPGLVERLAQLTHVCRQARAPCVVFAVEV